MGSGASILDHAHIRASTKNKGEKVSSKTEEPEILNKDDDAQTSAPNCEVGELVHTTSEKFSIFEEPVIDEDLAETERKIDERAARRLSRNILSGEIQGNVLQAQFSMKSLAPTIQHNEYVLQKTISTEAEGDRLHATSLADLRKNMREKLSNELQPPPLRTVSCIEGIDLPSLQELKPRKSTSGLDSFTSMPNLAPIPPIGKSFVSVDHLKSTPVSQQG